MKSQQGIGLTQNISLNSSGKENFFGDNYAFEAKIFLLNQFVIRQKITRIDCVQPKNERKVKMKKVLINDRRFVLKSKQ